MTVAIRYDLLAKHATDTESNRAALLEQVLVRDTIISDLRSYLMSWDMPIITSNQTTLEKLEERRERARRRLLAAVAEVLG